MLNSAPAAAALSISPAERRLEDNGRGRRGGGEMRGGGPKQTRRMRRGGRKKRGTVRREPRPLREEQPPRQRVAPPPSLSAAQRRRGGRGSDVTAARGTSAGRPRPGLDARPQEWRKGGLEREKLGGGLAAQKKGRGYDVT